MLYFGYHFPLGLNFLRVVPALGFSTFGHGDTAFLPFSCLKRFTTAAPPVPQSLSPCNVAFREADLPLPPPPTSLSRPLEGSACGLALVRPRPLPGSQDSREPGRFLRPPACQPVSSRPFQAFLRSQPFPHPGKLEVTIPSLVFTSQIAPWWKMVSSVGGHLIQSLSF